MQQIKQNTLPYRVKIFKKLYNKLIFKLLSNGEVGPWYQSTGLVLGRLVAVGFWEKYKVICQKHCAAVLCCTVCMYLCFVLVYHVLYVPGDYAILVTRHQLCITKFKEII